MRLVLILGDQLTLKNPALVNFDRTCDRIVMIEAESEGREVWSHKARIALFLSAMRHFRNALHDQGMPCSYVQINDERYADQTFEERLTAQIAQYRPSSLHMCEPGEWRMLSLVKGAADRAGVALHIHNDTHFLCSQLEFSQWAAGRKELRMEYFYREMRKRHAILMTGVGRAAQPDGGQWNFDADNRAAYPAKGPGDIEAPARFEPDAITVEVLALVHKHFSEHPGSLESFAWAVTREQALAALAHFIQLRLPHFGQYQDAMWTNTPFGWHSLVAASLNLHLIEPMEVVMAAEKAYRSGVVSLPSAEGFIRQLLGWREFIRGVYWLDMPGLQGANHHRHTRPLPVWYWTGETHMACMRDSVGQTLQHGYAHHIQRLMVLGQFGLLAGIAPKAVCDWFLAVFVDAVEWVELPNTAGMALFANGGRFTSKPYVASGAYINRQSNYCKNCRYRPSERVGVAACPFTTLYWNYLSDHESALANNPRTALMVRNLLRIEPNERLAIRTHAQTLLKNIDFL